MRRLDEGPVNERLPMMKRCQHRLLRLRDLLFRLPFMARYSTCCIGYDTPECFEACVLEEGVNGYFAVCPLSDLDIITIFEAARFVNGA